MEKHPKSSESATYTHGHHASVLRSHNWRTARNSLAYLLPHLTPSMRILDIGCGPGSITVDLALHHVPSGHVTGLELASTSSSVLDTARALAVSKGVTNVDFVEGDANALDFEDGTFDVVFAHQVLQHVRDPVGVLKEMRRVVKGKGEGMVAVRESDYASFVWFPDNEHHDDHGNDENEHVPSSQKGGRSLQDWRDLYLKLARFNGGEPNAGRMIHSWAKKAGFLPGQIQCSSSTWCFSTKEEIEWWSGLWAERTVASSFAETAIDAGLATVDDLERIAEGWRRWGEEDDAWFSVLHGEIICRKEK